MSTIPEGAWSCIARAMISEELGPSTLTATRLKSRCSSSLRPVHTSFVCFVSGMNTTTVPLRLVSLLDAISM
jgi:hypothetical protein